MIDDNINYGGLSYAFNTTVSTFSDVRTDFLQYRHTLFDTYRWSVSVTADLHATHFTVGLSDLNGGVSHSADAQAPLPLVGLRGLCHLHRWQLRAEAVYFKMTVNRIRGHLNDYTLSVSHPLAGGLSLEFGYNYYVLALVAARPDLSGNMRFAYQGPFLNLCYCCQASRADGNLH